MGNFWVDFFATLLDWLVPRRFHDRLSAVLLIVIGFGFATLAGFVVLKVVRDDAEPKVLVAALLFLGVSSGCFCFSRKMWSKANTR